MIKMVLFGDSITAGYTKKEITAKLTCRMSEYFPKADIINAGIPGETTEDGLKRIEAHVLKYKPDIVVIFFGANDAARHKFVSLDRYQRNLEEMIRLIGQEKVVLVSPPYTNQLLRHTDRPLERLMLYRDVTKKLAKKYHLPYVNMMTSMMAAPDPNVYLQKDGLHFSNKGYDLLAKEMARAIKESKGV